MRIATFNLENFWSDRVAAASLKERVAVLRPQLERLNADVLCLQEINADRHAAGEERAYPAMQALFEGTAYADYSWASTTVEKSHHFADKHNLITYSRYPIIISEQICNEFVAAPRHTAITADTDGDRDMELGWDRPLLYTQIGLPGGEVLHLVNLHLRAPLAVPIEGRKTGPFSWAAAGAWAEGFYLADVKRCGQALEARLLAERIFEEDRDALLLVCGDFNAQASETPVRIICAHPEDTGNGALARNALVPLDRTVPDSQRFSVLHAGKHQMLDHMLVSKSLLALSRGVEVHNEALEDELVAYSIGGENPASFHAPVVATFADAPAKD